MPAGCAGDVGSQALPLGAGAEAGYTLRHAIFERSGRLPGLERGICLIQRDEARHISFGVYVLRRLLSEHDHLVGLFEDQVAVLRHSARDDPEQILAGFLSRISARAGNCVEPWRASRNIGERQAR